MKIGHRYTPTSTRTKRTARKKTRKSTARDNVSLSGDRWSTPAVNLAKSVAIAGVVGAGLATAGLVGGLPAVGLAAVTGLVAGGSVKPATFPKTNAIGCFTSFGAAALLGATGPLGIVGGGALMAGLCLNSALCTAS